MTYPTVTPVFQASREAVPAIAQEIINVELAIAMGPMACVQTEESLPKWDEMEMGVVQMSKAHLSCGTTVGYEILKNHAILSSCVQFRCCWLQGKDTRLVLTK